MDIKLFQASSSTHYEAAKKLMVEYKELALGDDYDIGGGGLNEELEVFPGPYVPPKGLLFLSSLNNQICGCIALRTMSKKKGEVVRLYVQDYARSNGIAEKLLINIIKTAREIGYKDLYLDSFRKFKTACRLYEKVGFEYCDPYSDNVTEEMKDHMLFMHQSI